MQLKRRRSRPLQPSLRSKDSVWAPRYEVSAGVPLGRRRPGLSAFSVSFSKQSGCRLSEISRLSPRAPRFRSASLPINISGLLTEVPQYYTEVRQARDAGVLTVHERIGVEGLPAELSIRAGRFNEMLDRLEESFARLGRFSADT